MPASSPAFDPARTTLTERRLGAVLRKYGVGFETVPGYLLLSDQAAVLEQLDVSAAANSRLVGIVKDYVGSERETALLVSTRAWPLLAARVAGVARGPEGEQGLRARLKVALVDNSAWEQGPPGELAGRMVGQVLRALTTPPGAPVPDGPRASATAARSRSTTTPAGAAPGQAAPAEAAVPAHRRAAALVKGSGPRR